MKVLVVVDMQHMFPAARDADLIERINAAVASDCYVPVILCMDDSGTPTIRTAGAKLIWKRYADGGDEVYAHLMGAGLVSRNLQVVFAGVNQSQCVYQTAVTLARRLAEEHGVCNNVSIATDLCGDNEPFIVRFESTTP